LAEREVDTLLAEAASAAAEFVVAEFASAGVADRPDVAVVVGGVVVHAAAPRRWYGKRGHY
jgi:hypothetical protein